MSISRMRFSGGMPDDFDLISETRDENTLLET